MAGMLRLASERIANIRPAVALSEERMRAIVGYNSILATIDCSLMRAVSESRLFGVIYDFLLVDSLDEVVVIREIGVTRVSVLTGRRWEIDTDIIGTSRINEEGRLVVSLMDDERDLVIDVDTGKILQ
jgi:hypothetical protein